MSEEKRNGRNLQKDRREGRFDRKVLITSSRHKKKKEKGETLFLAAKRKKGGGDSPGTYTSQLSYHKGEKREVDRERGYSPRTST